MRTLIPQPKTKEDLEKHLRRGWNVMGVLVTIMMALLALVLMKGG